jgi:LysR family transcriptional regulator, hydrogen peroxide-inducible genes activator
MNLAQLTILLALDRHRHFGRAAQSCFLSQPALSMQLRNLERELGVQLFDRSRKPIEPTDVGRQLIDQARRIVDEVEHFRELAREREGETVGELRLGVIPTLGPYLLPSFFPRLTRCYPGLRVQVEEEKTEQVLERIRHGELDAGLVASGGATPALKETILFAEPFVAYLTRGHPLLEHWQLQAQDLADEAIWLVAEGHCFRDQVLSVFGREEGPTSPLESVRFESGQLETLKRLVDQSGGMTLLPELATHSLTGEEKHRLRAFAAPVPERKVRLVHGQAFLKRTLLRAFAEEVSLHVAELRRGPEDGR